MLFSGMPGEAGRTGSLPYYSRLHPSKTFTLDSTNNLFLGEVPSSISDYLLLLSTEILTLESLCDFY